LKEDIMETPLACAKCGKEVNEADAYENLGDRFCEDCYMDILSPPKACDPWAVYGARYSLQGQDKFAAITPLQQRIVDYVRKKGEAGASEMMEHLNLTEAELKRQFAVLRHMEILKGARRGAGVVYVLFDA
jgi:hypothetical protein